MTCYIERIASPIDAREYATADAAVAAFCAPKYTGDKGAQVEMLSTDSFKSMGNTYKIIFAANPKAARAPIAAPARMVQSVQFSRNLTREMNRADSDF